MFVFKIPLLIVGFSMLGMALYGQSPVSGLVINEEDQPIVGVSIVVRNSSQSTVSDESGMFLLNDLSEGSVLICSHVGYQTKEVTVLNPKEKITVVLMATSEALDEVVVVGYGTQRKTDLTGAIHRIDASQFQRQSSTNVLEMLSGTVAGFSSNQGTSAQGGGSMEIRGQTSIKASNDPLLVVDGVIYRGVITDINPSDIATIDILKDASAAAVYGAQSASGVLIITTKRGTAGTPKVNASTKLGVVSLTNMMRPFNAEEYLENRGVDTYQTYGDKPLYYYSNPNDLPTGVSLEDWKNLDATTSDDPVDMWLNRLRLTNTEKKNYLAGRTVDWFDMIFRNGLRQDYDLSISGGTPQVSYFASGGYTKNEGVILGDNFNVFRSRINLDIRAASFLKFSVDANYSNRNHGFTPVSISNAIGASPYGQVYADDGTMEWYTHEDATAPNPLIYYTYRERLNPVQSLFATISAELNLPFGITYKPSFVSNQRWVKDYTFDPVETPNGYNNGGSGSRSNTTYNEWMLDNLFSWNKTIGTDHQLTATFLYNIEKNQSWNDVQSNTRFAPNDALSFHALQAGINPSLNNNDSYSTGNALMGRLNYGYKSRYLLTLTIRRDGYSAFGQDNPYATFPSAALAWRISEEPFFKLEPVDELKLRLSWGANGNRSVGIYDALARLSTTQYIYGNELVTGVYSSTMANRHLRWESTEAVNAGIDFELLGRRLSGSLDGYVMKTTNLLIDRSLPSIIGYTNVASNLGELQNRGMELTLNSRNINRTNFSWSTAFNFSFNRNKITHLYGDKVPVMDANGAVIGEREADDVTNQWFIGRSIDQIWDYERLGIWQLDETDEAAIYGKKPGDVKLKDQNGDGVLTPMEDKIFQGNKKPLYNIGLRNDIRFLRDFELSLFLRADLGFFGNNPLYRETQWIDRKNILYAPYWTENKPSNEYPKLDTEVSSPDYGVWKSRSFVRLQDVTLSYNVPTVLLNRYQLQGLNLFVNMRNYLTITKWNHWDPESQATPMPKYITVGLNANL